MPNQEDTIVSLLHQNDQKAIPLIYEHYSAALYGVVLRIVKSEAIAEDVMQEAFVKVWKNAQKYSKTKGRLFTWLINIFRRTAIDKIRSKEYRTEKIQLTPNVVSKGGSYAINIGTIGLKDTVKKLPQEYADVVELAYFKGYTHKEVAEELNIPLGTAKTRIRSALKRLRELM